MLTQMMTGRWEHQILSGKSCIESSKEGKEAAHTEGILYRKGT